MISINYPNHDVMAVIRIMFRHTQKLETEMKRITVHVMCLQTDRLDIEEDCKHYRFQWAVDRMRAVRAASHREMIGAGLKGQELIKRFSVADIGNRIDRGDQHLGIIDFG